MTRGTEVILQFGPFVGLKGVIVATGDGGRVVTRVVIKEHAFLIELDEQMVEKSRGNQAAKGAGA